MKIRIILALVITFSIITVVLVLNILAFFLEADSTVLVLIEGTFALFFSIVSFVFGYVAGKRPTNGNGNDNHQQPPNLTPSAKQDDNDNGKEN